MSDATEHVKKPSSTTTTLTDLERYSESERVSAMIEAGAERTAQKLGMAPREYRRLVALIRGLVSGAK